MAHYNQDTSALGAILQGYLAGQSAHENRMEREYRKRLEAQQLADQMRREWQQTMEALPPDQRKIFAQSVPLANDWRQNYGALVAKGAAGGLSPDEELKRRLATAQVTGAERRLQEPASAWEELSQASRAQARPFVSDVTSPAAVEAGLRKYGEPMDTTGVPPSLTAESLSPEMRWTQSEWEAAKAKAGVPSTVTRPPLQTQQEALAGMHSEAGRATDLRVREATLLRESKTEAVRNDPDALQAYQDAVNAIRGERGDAPITLAKGLTPTEKVGIEGEKAGIEGKKAETEHTKALTQEIYEVRIPLGKEKIKLTGEQIRTTAANRSALGTRLGISAANLSIRGEELKLHAQQQARLEAEGIKRNDREILKMMARDVAVVASMFSDDVGKEAARGHYEGLFDMLSPKLQVEKAVAANPRLKADVAAARKNRASDDLILQTPEVQAALAKAKRIQ